MLSRRRGRPPTGHNALTRPAGPSQCNALPPSAVPGLLAPLSEHVCRPVPPSGHPPSGGRRGSAGDSARRAVSRAEPAEQPPPPPPASAPDTADRERPGVRLKRPPPRGQSMPVRRSIWRRDGLSTGGPHVSPPPAAPPRGFTRQNQRRKTAGNDAGDADRLTVAHGRSGSGSAAAVESCSGNMSKL